VERDQTKRKVWGAGSSFISGEKPRGLTPQVGGSLGGKCELKVEKSLAKKEKGTELWRKSVKTGAGDENF